MEDAIASADEDDMDDDDDDDVNDEEGDEGAAAAGAGASKAGAGAAANGSKQQGAEGDGQKALAVDNGDDALLLLRALAAQDEEVREKLKGQSEILGTRCSIM